MKDKRESKQIIAPKTQSQAMNELVGVLKDMRQKLAFMLSANNISDYHLFALVELRNHLAKIAPLLSHIYKPLTIEDALTTAKVSGTRADIISANATAQINLSELRIMPQNNGRDQLIEETIQLLRENGRRLRDFFAVPPEFITLPPHQHNDKPTPFF